MSYSPKLASTFNGTRLRTPADISPASGMCAVCTADCPGLCEVGLSAVRGVQALYPTNADQNQFASEKDYPVNFSHFNINGRVFGATGAEADSERTTPLGVDLCRQIGDTDPVRLRLPFVLPAIAKLNWQDYYAGAAMAGVVAVIGEAAVMRDSGLVLDAAGRVSASPRLADMVAHFRRYDRGEGAIAAQCNVDDEKMGVAEFLIDKLGVDCIELKFGQAAKGIQHVGLVASYDAALAARSKGAIVLPDPCDPEVATRVRRGEHILFHQAARLPMWDEQTLVDRVEELKSLGAKHVFFKMAGYNAADLERVVDIACAAGVDMITFDGAGGGSGNSPVKMMNEWGWPTVYLECLLHRILSRKRAEGKRLPFITIAGGIALEDQAFKALALGAPFVGAVALGRAAMAAAMTAKNTGEALSRGELPAHLRSYGESAEQVFLHSGALCDLYGVAPGELPAGAVGVYSYLERVGMGLRQLLALNRKFSLCHIERKDIIPLTRDARDLLRGDWF